MLVDSQGVGVITRKVHRLDPKTSEVKIISNTKLINGKICYFPIFHLLLKSIYRLYRLHNMSLKTEDLFSKN